MRLRDFSWMILLTALPGVPCRLASAYVAPPPPAQYFHDPKEAALVEASIRGDVARIDELVKKGANVDAIGSDGRPVLAWAMFSLNREGFSSLLAHGADPNIVGPGIRSPGHSLLASAAAASDPYWLDALLSKGGNPNLDTAPDGWPLFYLAIYHNKPQNALVLIKHGADLSHRISTGATPLLFAATLQKFDVVYELLIRGADSTALDNKGNGLQQSFDRYGSLTNIKRSGPFWENYQKVVRWVAEHPKPLSR